MKRLRQATRILTSLHRICSSIHLLQSYRCLSGLLVPRVKKLMPEIVQTMLTTVESSAIHTMSRLGEVLLHVPALREPHCLTLMKDVAERQPVSGSPIDLDS